MTDRSAGFKPALAYHVLPPLYDGVVALSTREQAFKPALVAQVAIQPGHDVLDIGCGTGTLVLLASSACPQARVTGLDADPAILALARRKAAGATAPLWFDQGSSTDLPYRDGSFDRVLSSLFFHHLAPADKPTTARQIACRASAANCTSRTGVARADQSATPRSSRLNCSKASRPPVTRSPVTCHRFSGEQDLRRLLRHGASSLSSASCPCKYAP